MVATLQRQLGLPVHTGSVSPLTLRGRVHTLALGGDAAGDVTLLTPPRLAIPAWVGQLPAAAGLEVVRTGCRPAEAGAGPASGVPGVEAMKVEGFGLAVASAERAVPKAVFRFPVAVDVATLRHLVEGLVDLRPDRPVELLWACWLQRVVRVFLVPAERAGHAWFRQLELIGLGPGPGKVQVAGGGVCVPEQRVSVPAELLRRTSLEPALRGAG